MRVLVTGGAGYVGSGLTALLLREGHQVRVLDSLMFGVEPLLGLYYHPSFEMHRGDVRNAEDVDAALDGMEAVIHLAAIVGEPACDKYPDLARATNLDSTESLVDRAKSKGISRFLLASTCSNYGIADVSVLADEEIPLSPVSLYAETKVHAEKWVVASAGTGFHAGVLRAATAFGLSPRMRFDLLLNELVRDAVEKNWVVIYGPESWRPFVHVIDIARAFAAALAAPVEVISGAVFNVGANSQNYQKLQLAELIKKHVPQAEIEVMDRRRDPRDYRVAFDKIAASLNFTTTISAEAGIKEMAETLINGLIKDSHSGRYDNVH